MSQMTMGATFLDVIVDVPAVGDRRFTYSCAGEIDLPRGAKVRVPFGRSMADGFVVGKGVDPSPVRPKPIEYVYDLDFLPPPHLLEMARDLAAYYCASTASFWSCLWPAVVPKKSVDRLLKDLASKPSTPLFDDSGVSGGAPSPDSARAQVPVSDAESALEEALAPTSGSRSLSERIAEVPVELVWGSADFRWKTYLGRIGEALRAGRGVLFLAPEVNGLRDALERVSPQFAGEICPLHSDMTGLFRRSAWLSIAKAEKKFAAGTRSAAFAPVKDLGLIILEDEPSAAHKSLESPFYDARTVALCRSLDGAKIMFGAAHPSASAVWNWTSGKWTCIREVDREPSRKREAVILDMRETRPSKEIISQPLHDELERAFGAGKRAILFLNRRGDSSQISCQDCGNAIVCSRCGVPLAYHAKEGQTVCHICGLKEEAPAVCPTCGGHRWRMSGYGIERAESEFRRKFPEVPVFRLDQDTAKKVAPADTLQAFGGASPSCLVATQMVLGQKLPPCIGVVGVLSADTALAVPDFRASEKAYHLLTRLGDFVAPGGDFTGAFVIQTRNAGHHAIRGVADSSAFYEEELQNRRMLGYPPFKRFFKIRFGGKTFERVRDAAAEFAGRVPTDEGVRVLGPVPAPKPRVRGLFWWQVALRGEDHGAMSDICRCVLAETSRSGAVRILIDVDPVDME